MDIPVLMVVPELNVIPPPKQQFALFDTFKQPNEVHVAPGKGHLSVLSGEESPMFMKMPAEFIRDVLAGKSPGD